LKSLLLACSISSSPTSKPLQVPSRGGRVSLCAVCDSVLESLSRRATRKALLHKGRLFSSGASLGGGSTASGNSAAEAAHMASSSGICKIFATKCATSITLSVMGNLFIFTTSPSRGDFTLGEGVDKGRGGEISSPVPWSSSRSATNSSSERGGEGP